VSPKLLLGFPLALLAIWLAGGSPGQAAHRAHKHRQKPPQCSLGGSKTLYRDSDVRVYSKYYRAFEERDTYACMFAVNKRLRIATNVIDEREKVHHLVLALPYIAYWNIQPKQPNSPYSFVSTLNLRTGVRRGTVAYDAVAAVGVTHRGSVAWMDSEPPGTSPPYDTYYVRKVDAGGNQVDLDSGKDIDPTSFAVGGRYIYWTKAGAPQSATMP